MVKAGADITRKADNGVSSLSLARKAGHKETIDYLLEHGAGED